jgi:hypothetical protein
MAIIDPPISAILPAELRCEEISKRHVEHFVGDTVNAAKPLDYGFGRSSGARSRNCAIQPSLTVSTGSAFTSATFEPSHVLSAMGLPADQANASVRFSFGRSIRRTPRTPFDREERTSTGSPSSSCSIAPRALVLLFGESVWELDCIAAFPPLQSSGGFVMRRHSLSSLFPR